MRGGAEVLNTLYEVNYCLSPKNSHKISQLHIITYLELGDLDLDLEADLERLLEEPPPVSSYKRMRLPQRSLPSNLIKAFLISECVANSITLQKIHKKKKK